MQPLLETWHFRHFILAAVQREFQVRYTNAILGGLWAIAQPLALIMVYTVVFSQVMRMKLPGIPDDFAFSIYLCAGVLTWGYFSEMVSRLLLVFTDNAQWLKKLRFPKQSLIAIVVLSASLNFAIIFSLFVGFLILTKHFPGWVFLALFPLFALQILLSIGLGVTLAIINVFFRDVGQFMAIALQFWFWLTPIVYPIAALPKYAQQIVALNPMTPLMGAYQDVLVYARAPNWIELLPLLLASLALIACALYLYRQHATDILDEL
jgi:lipopolysaccharide transport system permease protein